MRRRWSPGQRIGNLVHGQQGLDILDGNRRSRSYHGFRFRHSGAFRFIHNTIDNDPLSIVLDATRKSECRSAEIAGFARKHAAFRPRAPQIDGFVALIERTVRPRSADFRPSPAPSGRLAPRPSPVRSGPSEALETAVFRSEARGRPSWPLASRVARRARQASPPS